MGRYVLDAFAVLEMLKDGAGAPAVADLLQQEHGVFWMSVINLGEVYYATARACDAQAAEASVQLVFQQENITVVDVDWTIAKIAARYKAEGGISYADAFACALAQRFDAAIVTGDPEFRKVRGVDIAWITT